MKSPEQIKLLLAAARLRGIEFTAAQAPDAWPNGSRVVKTELRVGDAHQVGEFATVIGSIGPIPFEGREKSYAYFVIWDRPPGADVPVLCHDCRLGLVPHSSGEQDECLATEAEAVQHRRQCPDCGAPLQEGPHGGLSVNWYCIAENCGSRFNDEGPFGVQRISDAMPKRGVV